MLSVCCPRTTAQPSVALHADEAPMLLIMHARYECMLWRPARRVCACMQTQAHVQLVDRDARASGQPDPYSVR